MLYTLLVSDMVDGINEFLNMFTMQGIEVTENMSRMIMVNVLKSRVWMEKGDDDVVVINKSIFLASLLFLL